MPLAALFDAAGPVDAARGADLDVAQVSACLRAGAWVIVAEIGAPLRWLRGKDAFEWWKHEGRPRLWDPAIERLDLGATPDGRAWRASEWTLGGDDPAVVFEAYH